MSASTELLHLFSARELLYRTEPCPYWECVQCGLSVDPATLTSGHHPWECSDAAATCRDPLTPESHRHFLLTMLSGSGAQCHWCEQLWTMAWA